MRVVERDFPIALLGRVVSGAARIFWELENGDSDGRWERRHKRCWKSGEGLMELWRRGEEMLGGELLAP